MSDKLSSVTDFKIIIFIEDQNPWNIVDAAFDNVLIKNSLSIEEGVIDCKFYFKNNILQNNCSLDLDFSVYDMNGRVLYINSSKFDFSNHPRGVYLIKTVGNRVQKIIW